REILAGGADPAAVAARFGVPLTAAFRRLAGLPGAGYGLIRCDGAGALILRLPPEGFQLPRLGAACPLWPLYQALNRPGQPIAAVIEQAARRPRLYRAWALAEAETPADFARPPAFTASMLLLP